MDEKNEKKNLIFSLFFLSLGGWMLHFRIHPIIESNPAHFFPFLYGLVNILVVPFLLNDKKTFLIGYLINGFGVLFGIVIMAKFSLSGLPHPLTVTNILFKTTLADILLLLPKLFIGQRILYVYYPTGTGRLFTSFWWTRHLAYISILFTIGHFLGR